MVQPSPPASQSTPITRPELRFGVCGWDFADWDGPLYPKPRPRGYRALPLLATFLDLVEVNATFYHPMGGDVSKRWLDETPESFTFVLKAFRGWTHENGTPSGVDLVQFLEVLEPVADAGRLEGVLIQFPPWIRRFDTALEKRLMQFRRTFAQHRLFVEVRHQDLYRTDFFDFLSANELGFVNVDLPEIPALPKLTSINTSDVGYVRLHGRHHDGWANPKATRDERYDYEYTARDLDEVIEKIDKISGRTRSTLIAANNHFRAQAPAALVACRQRLGLDISKAPAQLTERIPGAPRAAH